MCFPQPTSPCLPPYRKEGVQYESTAKNNNNKKAYLSISIFSDVEGNTPVDQHGKKHKGQRAVEKGPARRVNMFKTTGLCFIERALLLRGQGVGLVKKEAVSNQLDERDSEGEDEEALRLRTDSPGKDIEHNADRANDTIKDKGDPLDNPRENGVA